MDQNDDFEKLQKALATKRDEIDTHITKRLGLEKTNLAKMSDADLLKICGLTNDIAMALKAIVHKDLIFADVLKPGLQLALAEYFELSKQFNDQFEAAREELVKKGFVVASGKRAGQIVWKINPNLTETQRKAMFDLMGEIMPEHEPEVLAAKKLKPPK